MATETLSWFPITTQQNGDQCLLHLCAKGRFMYLSFMITCFNIIAIETCLHSNRHFSSKILMNHLILLSSTSTIDNLRTLYQKYTTGHNVLISIATNVVISIATALSTFTSKIIHFPRGNNGIIKKETGHWLWTENYVFDKYQVFFCTVEWVLFIETRQLVTIGNRLTALPWFPFLVRKFTSRTRRSYYYCYSVWRQPRL